VKAKHAARLLDRYRVTDGRGFRLKDYDPADNGGGIFDPKDADKRLADGVARLSDLQTALYADDRWSLLLVLQAMDAAGKDGTVKHVMTGVNPAGISVSSFKQPGPEDLMHGFLWRVHAQAPARGHIAIFNRSHYEDVLITRVHPELLDHLKLPDAVRAKKFWKHRLADIANFEDYLAHQGTLVLKIFLHLSRDEQKRRFLKRIEEPAKNWKFSSADIKERDYWDEYQQAYEEAITATASPHAPWFIVPADNKPFAHLIVAEAIIEALSGLDLKPPSPSVEECARLAEAKVKLEAE
jgi:PPK2 family polyphosphate:nucleotide phosphotransferase